MNLRWKVDLSKVIGKYKASKTVTTITIRLLLESFSNPVALKHVRQLIEICTFSCPEQQVSPNGFILP